MHKYKAEHNLKHISWVGRLALHFARASETIVELASKEFRARPWTLVPYVTPFPFPFAGILTGVYVLASYAVRQRDLEKNARKKLWEMFTEKVNLDEYEEYVHQDKLNPGHYKLRSKDLIVDTAKNTGKKIFSEMREIAKDNDIFDRQEYQRKRKFLEQEFEKRDMLLFRLGYF